jgi:hypothetical protein
MRERFDRELSRQMIDRGRRRAGAVKRSRRRGRRLAGGLAVALTALTAGLTPSSALAGTPARIYWIDSAHIESANLDGTNPWKVVDIPGGPVPSAYSVAVDAQYLYWTNTNIALGIGRVHLDGSAPDLSFISAPGASGLAVDGQHIYWSNFLTGSIEEANLDGTHVNPTLITGLGNVHGLAVDGGHIYWAENNTGRIGRANLDGSAPNPSFITAQIGVENIAVDAQHIYWTNTLNFIGRANLDGSAVNNSFLSAVLPFGIAVGASHIFWTSVPDPPDSIESSALDGSGVATLFQASPTSFVFRGITVSAAAAQVSPVAPAAFGATAQGSVSAALTLTVTNAGNLGLSLSGLTFAAADPSDFFVASNGCLDVLDPGQSCRLTVSFAPQGQGARSATLQIASNDPSGPLQVALTGTGTTLPVGPAGPTGPQGQPGAAGPQGPPGVAGKVVCRDTVVARAICTLEFAPGTWAVQGSTVRASFRISRAGRTVERGRLIAVRGQIARKPIGRLRRGRYTLVITIKHGPVTTVLLTRRFRVR